MVGSGPHLAQFAGFQQQDDFLHLERERDRERYRVCTLPIQVEATLKWEVIYFRGKTATKPYSWKLIT